MASKWEIYNQATEQWGQEDQLWMLVGELGELMDQLGKRVQGRMDRDQLIDEIADAQIMLEQLQEMIDTEEVSLRKAEKLKRLEEKLNFDE